MSDNHQTSSQALPPHVQLIQMATALSKLGRGDRQRSSSAADALRPDAPKRRGCAGEPVDRTPQLADQRLVPSCAVTDRAGRGVAPVADPDASGDAQLCKSRAAVRA